MHVIPNNVQALTSQTRPPWVSIFETSPASPFVPAPWGTPWFAGTAALYWRVRDTRLELICFFYTVKTSNEQERLIFVNPLNWNPAQMKRPHFSIRWHLFSGHQQLSTHIYYASYTLCSALENINSKLTWDQPNPTVQQTVVLHLLQLWAPHAFSPTGVPWNTENFLSTHFLHPSYKFNSESRKKEKILPERASREWSPAGYHIQYGECAETSGALWSSFSLEEQKRTQAPRCSDDRDSPCSCPWPPECYKNICHYSRCV